MGTKPLPHAGMGVGCYAWCTSPLRRYADLVNQWQLLACVRQGPTAALVAPFKPKDSELLGIISAFDTAYSAYNAHQSSMERYWTLKYLKQEGVDELLVQVIKDLPGQAPMVRASELPLVFPLLGAPQLHRGQTVLVRLTHLDELSLDVRAEYIRLIDESDGASQGQAHFLDGHGDGDDEEDLAPTGVVLALDANEPENPTP